MQKFYWLIILLLSVNGFVQAQSKVTIRGAIIDSATSLPLSNASISLMHMIDSSQIAFSIADTKGLFTLKNIPSGRYNLLVTFTGYSFYNMKIMADSGKTSMDLGIIKMSKQSELLDEVIVTRPPIAVKKDTVEFTAGAFQTKPNATAEDLLKKLPGVEVDKDGNITSQGEAISKVYVDGKEFFSNDPKLATKNLTADMIESVQVFDDMSDQAKFTKIDDGSKQKTINIKLKKNRKKGYFGRATAGAGSESRYTGSAMLNSFRDNTQVSVLGGANNINVAGFTSSDMFGGGRGRGGGSDGNTRVWNGGFNYRDKWGTKMEVSGNYFVSGTNTTNNSETYRENLFANDSTSVLNSTSRSGNRNVNNNVFLRLEYFIDSMNSLLATPRFNIQHSENINEYIARTVSTSPLPEYLAITSNNNNNGNRDGWNFGNSLLYRHRFKKIGRTFTAGWNTSFGNNNGISNVIANSKFYNNDGTAYKSIDQHLQNDQAGKSFNNTLSMSYTEGLGENKILEFNYAYTNNQNTSDKKSYNYDSTNGKFEIPNTALTNYFENSNISHRAGSNFRFKKEKYDFQVGGAVNFSQLKNNSIRLDSTRNLYTNQHFMNIFPTANFNYNLGARKSIRFDYRGSTQQPNINQLQNVIDSTNQLHLSTGNPNLKQQFSHDLGLNYRTFNVNNFMFLSVDLRFSTVTNKIVNRTITIDKAQLSYPVNIGGTYSSSLYLTTGIPLIKVATGKKSPLNLNLSSSVRFNKDVSMLDSIKNFSNNWVLRERVNLNLNIKDKLDVSLNANLTFNSTTYSVQKNNNINYFTYRYSLDFSYTFLKSFILSSDFDYYVNAGRSGGFNQNIPSWNASIAKQLFEKKNAEVRFAVVDILNQNQSIRRSTSDFYVQDVRTEVMQRFFMVSVLYNLGKFGGKSGSMINRGDGFRGRMR